MKFIRKIEHFIKKIKSIFDWSKIIWNDEDWDYGYLLDMLEYKLTRMQKYFKSGKITTTETYEEMLKSLNVAVDACSQLVGDKFEEEFTIPHYDKYPIGDLFEHINNPMSDEERTDFLAMVEAEEAKRQELIHLLFDTIRDNYRMWWD